MLRFLGQIRPERLLSKVSLPTWGLIQAAKSPALLVCESIGLCEVVGFETGTGTFIAEGFASHNSDESAFQPEFDASYTAARPCLEGGGQYIAISSANPGSFCELVEGDKAS